MTNAGMRSRVTKKGQITVPADLRKQFHIEAGNSVQFEKTEHGIMIKPIKDILDSAGDLSEFANVDDVINDLIESRKKRFW